MRKNSSEYRIWKKKNDYKKLRNRINAKKVNIIIKIIENIKKEIYRIKYLQRQNNLAYILATSSSMGEGFDDNRLDTLFLTMPVSWKGRIIQYVGRLHREHEDKEKVIVYDYLDNMKVLEKMYNRRLKGYKIAGYEIIE